MRRMFFIITALLAGAISKGQVAFYDAQKLRGLHVTSDRGTNKINLPQNDNVFKILKFYVPDTNASANGKIAEAFENNPFLSFASIPDGGSPLPGGNLISKIGGVNVSGIADGLAQFLIKRGREELNIAFFQRMQDFLNKNDEARTLFPSTAAFLGSIASYRYAELLQSLREAFYKDISNLLVNLNLLIDLPKYQDLLKALPEIRIAVRSAKIISELSQGDNNSIHPADLIHQLSGLNEWGEMNINLQSSWLALDRISESLRRMDSTEEIQTKPFTVTTDSFFIQVNKRLSDSVIQIDNVPVAKGKSLIISSPVVKLVTSTKAAWISFSDFNNNILNNDTTLRIYLGLLYQRMQGIGFRNAKGETVYVQAFMDSNQTNILKLADLAENFLVLGNDVEKSIKEIKEKNGLSNDDYYTYIEKAINVVDYGFKVANVIDSGIAGDRYIVMARNANNLYKNIYTKNYNAAVMNAYLILEEILTKSEKAVQEKEQYFTSVGRSLLSPQFSADYTKDTATFFQNVSSMNNKGFLKETVIEERTTTVERILKYGNLIASVVKAESAEEAEAAIEAAVLPAGSSSIKKNTAFNVSLNAYIGGYFARSVNNTDKIDGNSSKTGVAAPVGVAFNFGLGHYPNGNPVGSLSLYGTLIDVGAIAGYRLNNDSTELNQKVTLNDIFTPGGYIVYGIGTPFKWLSYVPLSVGYGWQYGSKLYYKKGDGTLGISDQSRWRSNWFLGVDIPLANFFSRNYVKRKP